MGNTKKRSREHLTIDERKEIERSLYDNMSFASIARALDKSPSTISREVYRNRRSEGPSSTRAADNTDCEHLRTCKIKGLCGHDYFCKENTTKLCKRCEVKTCHDLCDEYEKRLCPSVEHAPLFAMPVNAIPTAQPSDSGTPQKAPRHTQDSAIQSHVAGLILLRKKLHTSSKWCVRD